MEFISFLEFSIFDSMEFISFLEFSITSQISFFQLLFIILNSAWPIFNHLIVSLKKLHTISVLFSLEFSVMFNLSKILFKLSTLAESLSIFFTLSLVDSLFSIFSYIYDLNFQDFYRI